MTRDASLHLLDRQVIDVAGRLVGKVDDVELTEEAGELVVTGLLVGLGGLLPRFGRRLGPWLNRRYAQISVSHAARRAPAVIDLDHVDRVDGLAPVAAVIRRLHRHSRAVAWGLGVSVDWEKGRVILANTALGSL